ncbi:helix-turn-helix domain-containing protein [Desulfoscipio geothermicus]|uniref:DNA-binding transcriptional regulator, XRE-family HTH domain n=1 Tax=Desulfoscipio geothermicus DSM 3669 TaxID=1121426 RepID=A0A1I6DNY9_9FIRM|nr:helix-turn-helix transcriptional regulator [Desulfoscipio geothermicus]SFR07223.1 DNA-binding transcriptional regulator, XRE-family HTH domain [Desulfoscipio geothermicus DSM 3669]
MKIIVGKNIKHFRILRGFSQKEAALLAGITSSYWGYLERGKKNPSIELIEKIADVLGIEVHLLFIDSQNKKLPAELMQSLYIIKGMEAKHLQFISTILKAYIKIHKN